MAGREAPLVQWTYMQYKSLAPKRNAAPSPDQRFLHSCTQIGSKMLIYGGSDKNGEPITSLFLYDAMTFQWSIPNDSYEFQEDHPGPRYGHSATLIDMHPPRVMFFGGVVGGGTFEFDSPEVATGSPSSSPDKMGSGSISETMGGGSLFTSRSRPGRKTKFSEESDDRVFFLELRSDKWLWSKPLVRGTDRPLARTEHTAVKISTNDVAIFGGWATGPMNDFWVFDTVDMEWKEPAISGIRPRPRYRHSCELLGSVLYILGGSDNNEDEPDGLKYLNVHALHLDTMEWVHPEIRGINPFPRSGHASAALGAKMIAVFGGKRTRDVYLNDTIIIDITSFSTTVVNAVQSHLPTPVTGSTMTAVGNRCFVFGGTDARGSCYNDIRMLDVGDYLDPDDVTVRAGASSEYCFKIIIIGDASVGKSALLSRFSDNVFLDTYSTTIGIDFNSKMIRVDKAICKLEIWDTAGQERFSTITANYYRGAQGALLVYDIGNKESFAHVQNWYDRARQLGGESMETIIIGNKNDLTEDLREVSTLEGEEFSNSLGIQFIETSALNGTNVEKAFVSMTSAVKKSVDARGLTGVQASSMQKTGSVSITNTERKPSMTERCCG